MFCENFSGICNSNGFFCDEYKENLNYKEDDGTPLIFLNKSQSFCLDDSIFLSKEIANNKIVNENFSIENNKSENTTFSTIGKETEQISSSNQSSLNNNIIQNEINDLTHLLPNHHVRQNVKYKFIPEEKKKLMGRKRRNDESNRNKSWDNEMDVWKNLRVKINKSMYSILNKFSKKYGFSKFYRFNGNISTKKDINEILLNENVKNYIIRQGISNNFNKGKTEQEKEKINKNNLNLICKILQYESNLDEKPFTEFVNMKFESFYYDIFLNIENKDINIFFKNENNFHQFINNLEGEKKNVYVKIAMNIYKIYKDKKSRTPKIKV
jgi:hypothetical protein